MAVYGWVYHWVYSWVYGWVYMALYGRVWCPSETLNCNNNSALLKKISFLQALCELPVSSLVLAFLYGPKLAPL